MPERTIPDNKEVLYELKEQKATFKLIKVYASNNEEIRMDDKSHTQLFYNTTDKTSLATCTPSYSRDVYRPNNKIDSLYWYSEALKSVTTSSPLWTIEQPDIRKSKLLGRIKRPKVFSISNVKLQSRSVFEYGSTEHEPKGYSGEVSTPFDQSSFQRYRWVKYKDNSRWVFIARNDPNRPLVELRKTSYENEFDIVFLESPPPGWRLGNVTIDPHQSAQFTGRYPSVFSNPSTYRSSTTSGFLSNRESSFSDVSNNGGGGYDKNSRLFSTYSESKFAPLKSLKNIGSEQVPEIENSDKHWQEFVLASTVTIQDEVNSNKKRLWKNNGNN